MDTRMTLTILLLILFSSFARAEWRIEAETGVVYNSNLSNSDRSADVRDDWAWRGDISAANGLQLTRDLRLNFGADLRGEVWDRFDAFNNIGPGASAGLRYRFGLGRQAPWVLLEDRFGYDRFQDTAQSGYDNVLNFQAGIALSDRLALEGSYTFESFVTPDDFYDRQVHRGNARMLFDVTSSLQIAIGYIYREGDVISYAVPPRPDIARISVERMQFRFQLPINSRGTRRFRSATNMPSPCTIRCNTRTTWWKRTSPSHIEMRPSRGFVLLTVLVFAGDLLAGSLEVIVKDDKGRPGPDAVAYVVAAGTASAAPKKHAVVDQRDKQFIPYVTAV